MEQIGRRTLRRVTARVLPVNREGKVLLLHGWSPHAPESPYWFSIGGACEPGESLAAAAARELFEETGIEVDASVFDAPFAFEPDVEFDWGDVHLIQDQHWFALAVDHDVEIHFRGLEPLEVGTIDAAEWWSPDMLRTDGSAARATLPAMMRLAIEAVGREGGRPGESQP